ncbi:MAG: HigA family addiction module antitoxin [Thiohalomonadales bacterium]
MSKKVYKKPERAPSHAGRILKSGFIDQYDLRIETVAELLGIARGHLSRIINAHSPVTPDIAIKLEVLTKTPASHWLAIQSKYDTYLMEQKKEFIKYKETLNNWVNNSLPMQPEERRSDKKSQRLVTKASNIAKQLSKKKKVA